MDPKMTPDEALAQAGADLLATGARAARGPEGAGARLRASLAELGFAVAKDYHSRAKTDRAEHDKTCSHCGRPENAEPFVVPGTPLELMYSEGDEGRFRIWGGSDLWMCRAHPHYQDGDVATGSSERWMEIQEAVEHLAARDHLEAPLHMRHADIEAAKAAYAAANAARLSALDAAAPGGGHQGNEARKTAAAASSAPQEDYRR